MAAKGLRELWTNMFFVFLFILPGTFGLFPDHGPTTQSSGPIRVSVDPSNSKVQVFHDGSWSYVCANQWDNRDAQVVCRMMGYWHGQGTADLRQLNQGDVILLDQMVCQGNESVIDQCSFRGFLQQTCSVGAVGAVNCDPTVQVQTRLTGGYGPWEGRLEVLRAGQWRPVCRNGFDDQDAQVVCRMLGLRNSGGKAHAEEKFAQSNLSPLIRELDCTGAESDIAQCKGTDAGTGENCPNAGVECYSCGGLFHGESGMVESENYPLSYPRNLNCLYVIRPIDEQQLYKLEFGNFSTEACCDTLQVGVLTGASNLPAGQTYSGVAMPPRLLGNAFALNFATDGSHALQGFHATWSPAVVQDVVSVSCADGHLRVDIDLTFLKRLYPLSSEATVALADPTCVGVVTASAGEDRLIITAQADQCGTKVVSDGHSIVYSNFLVDRVFDARSPLIVRQRRWDIPIHCAVVRTDDFDVLYHPVPHLNKRDTPNTNLPEAPKSSLPEAEVAHARESREVRGSLAVDLDFPVTITAFQDRTYTQIATSPLARKLGDDLDLRVEFTGGDLDLKLVLQNCQTQPELGSHVNYAIIKNGCPVDAETQVLSYNAHSTDFRFKAFEFSGDFPHIYLTCDVRVCLTNDNDAGCRQSCSSALPLVGKRSASDPIIVRESDSKVYALTFGPIVVGH